MATNKAMTLNLSHGECAALEVLAEKQDMTKTALIRQALRLYQYVTDRSKDGCQMAFVKDGQVVPLHIIGCGLSMKDVFNDAVPAASSMKGTP